MENESITPVELFPPKQFRSFNINCSCRVKPTEYGMEIIRNLRARLQKEIPSTDWSNYLKPKSDGYLEMQTWSMMEVFGKYMKMGGHVPISTEILLESPTVGIPGPSI